jgi:hypothetical protein
VSPKPRYHDPTSVSSPSLSRKAAAGPTLLTLDRNAPKYEYRATCSTESRYLTAARK